MTALWDIFTLDGQALYWWAAVFGVLVFIVAELVLLEVRRRSIRGHLGSSGQEGLKQGEPGTHTTAATGSETGGYK